MKTRALSRRFGRETAYLEQMRLTIAAVGRVSAEDLSPARREEMVALFRNWRSS